MRLITALILSLAFTLVAMAAPAKVSDADVEFLIASAVKDFRAHGPKFVSKFRNVRVGRIPVSEGELNSLMCGEFENDKKGWDKFATIKTSDYEQWIGGGGFCENVSVQWDADRDLTAELQKRFDAGK